VLQWRSRQQHQVGGGFQLLARGSRGWGGTQQARGLGGPLSAWSGGDQVLGDVIACNGVLSGGASTQCSSVRALGLAMSVFLPQSACRTQLGPETCRCSHKGEERRRRAIGPRLELRVVLGSEEERMDISRQLRDLHTNSQGISAGEHQSSCFELLHHGWIHFISVSVPLTHADMLLMPYTSAAKEVCRPRLVVTWVEMWVGLAPSRMVPPI